LFEWTLRPSTATLRAVISILPGESDEPWACRRLAVNAPRSVGRTMGVPKTSAACEHLV